MSRLPGERWLPGADILSMNGPRVYQYAADRLVWLALAAWLILPSQTMGAAEEKLEVFRTRTAVYTNVTITTKATNYVFILHSAGMTSVRVADLLPETLEQLGYIKPRSVTVPTNAPAVWAKQELAKLPDIASFRKQLAEQWRNQLPTKLSAMGLAGTKLIYALLGVLLLIYLFGCYCCALICRKAGHPPGILILLPWLQWIPLLRAASMSAWWFLAFLVPLLNLVPAILWPLRIAKARGKSVWVGVLLLLPVTNLFAFLYLAFSDRMPAGEGEESGEKVMSLQVS